MKPNLFFQPLIGRLFLGAFLCTAAQLHAETAPEKSNPAGQELAADLRSALPDENSEITGVLKIHAGKKREEIPVLSKIILHGNTYETLYSTKATGDRSAEQLTVIHSTNGPSQYFYAKAKTPADPLPQPQKISATQAANTSFAGSDFTVADLGLEFLHWPEQRRLKATQLRLGRDCFLLESQNPDASEMVRVKSYIDKESGGLLVADGFNKQNEAVKKFSLSGSSFTKVNGHWKLEKMTISSPQKDSETVLQFNLPKD